MFWIIITPRGSVTVARKPHKLEVVGAIPAPATNTTKRLRGGFVFYCQKNKLVL